MIQPGTTQTLEVLRTTNIGVYLGEAPDPLAVFAGGPKNSSKNDDASSITDVLLPRNEIKKSLAVGDRIEVFVYLDSEDRPIATCKAPMLSLGSIAVLTCKDVNSVGAFLDWGLPKDLFLPYHEQTCKVKPGEAVPVSLYLDKSHRLCATMKLYKRLRTDSPYKATDHVTGTVYELSDEHGAYIAIDNQFSGLIPARDLIGRVRIGDSLEVRVSRVLPDGKLELSMRELPHLQLSQDCDIVYQTLQESLTGFLPYHDKSDALIIKTKFNMSKNAFKRAIGHLMRQGLIEIRDDGIKLIE